MRYDGGEVEMPEERPSRPGVFDLLRRLALSAERAAAREAAGSAVRGATEELREQFPELDEELRELLSDAFTALRRLARSAAEGGEDLDTRVHSLSEAAVRGALDELDRQWQGGGLPLHDFSIKLNRFLDQAADFAGSKAEHFKNPAERARTIAGSAVEGATAKFHESIPEMTDELRTLLPVAREAAQQIGRGLAEGIVGGTKEHSGELTQALEGAGAAIARGLTAGFVSSAREGVKAMEEFGPTLGPLATNAASAVAKGAASAVFEELRGAVSRAGQAAAGAARAIVKSPGLRKGAGQKLAAVGAGSIFTIGAFLLGTRAGKG